MKESEIVSGLTNFFFLAVLFDIKPDLFLLLLDLPTEQYTEHQVDKPFKSP